MGILPFLKQDDWGVMVGVGIDQGFFFYFFRARRDHTETGQLRITLLRIPPDRCGTSSAQS